MTFTGLLPKLEWVYFVHCPSCRAVKIGYTKRIWARPSDVIRDHEWGQGCRGAYIIGWLAGAMGYESRLHEAFGDLEYEMAHEWFRDEPGLLAWVRLLAWAGQTSRAMGHQP